MDEEIELGEEATTWSAVGAAVLVAATWALLFVGVVSFGPGSVAVAALVFAVGGVGFVLSPFVPFAVRARSIAVVLVVIGAVALGLVAGRYTPPTAARMDVELTEVLRELGPSSGPTILVGEPLAPWAAPPATGGVRVSSSGSTPLDAVVAGLERRGWEVEVLRSEADGLSAWRERERGSIPWDLRARKDRFELRAAFSGPQVHARLAWHSLVRGPDPFVAHGLAGVFLGLGAAGIFAVVAAIAGMVGIVLTLASVGLTVWAAARVARDDRPYRHDPTGEDTGS